MSIGVVVKHLDKKWRRRYWLDGEYIYYNRERATILTVYKSGKERKWIPTTEDLINEDWVQFKE